MWQKLTAAIFQLQLAHHQYIALLEFCLGSVYFEGTQPFVSGNTLQSISTSNRKI